MKFIHKVLPFIFVVFLAGFILGGYFFIHRKTTFSPGLFVPNEANAVIYIKPARILSDFHSLLRENPTLIDSISDSKIDFTQIRKEAKGNGINPLSDVAVYTFEKNKAPFIGAILDVFNSSLFETFMLGEKTAITPYKKGQIILSKNGTKGVIKKNGVTVFVRPIDNQKNISNDFLIEIFDEIFEQKKLLVEQSANFKQFISSEKHLGIWLDKDNKYTTPFSDKFHILDNFGDKFIDFKAQKENIELRAVATLLKKDFLVPGDKTPVQLAEKEIAKLSLTTTPKYAEDILSKTLPPSFQYIAHYCRGEICSGFIGYRTKPAFIEKLTEQIDPKTFHTITAIDTVEFSPLLNIPEMMTVAKINRPQELIDRLKLDSLVTSYTNYFSIPHPVFVNEHLYLKINQDNLFIGTSPEFNQIVPEFTTFSFCYHAHRSIDFYPPKNAVQKMGMLAIPEIPISTINIYYDSVLNDTILLKGDVNFRENPYHSLLQLTAEFLKYRGLVKGLL